MMKRFNLLFCCVVAMIIFGVGASVGTRGQRKGSQTPDASTMRDPEMEKDSMHNLDVARQYFKLKKAYRASLARCEEIIAGNPNFSHLDEALYLAGESSLRLSEHRGKQAPNIAPDKLRSDAREYLSRLVNEFPDSRFRKSAEEDLRTLGGVKPKAEGKQ